MRRLKRNSLLAIFKGLIQTLIHSVPYLCFFSFLLFLVGGSMAYAFQGDLFTLKKVIIMNHKPLSEIEALSFTGLERNQRIFSIDLKDIERRIKTYHPEYREVIVARILPHEIRVFLKKREPLAYVKFKDFYPIDTEAYVLSAGFEVAELDLPIIKGVPEPRESLKKGSRLYYIPLGQTIRLLEFLSAKDILRHHHLTEVNIANPKNILLILDDKVEVRMGFRNLTEKLLKLNDAIETIGIDPEKVSYVDLRFEDIVYGTR